MRAIEIKSAPGRTSPRQLAPDLLRGIAILLLVLTNVPLIFTTVRYQQAAGVNPFTGEVWNDLALAVFLGVPTITGMGMFILAMGQGLSSAGINQRSYRVALIRLLLIGALGVLHGLAVWWGDILFYYLLAGLIALYFRNRPARSQVLIGICIMLMPLVLTVSDLIAQLGGVTDEVAVVIRQAVSGYGALQASAVEAYSSGDFTEISLQRLTDWASYWQDFALIGIVQLTGLLLVGIGLSQMRNSLLVLWDNRRFTSAFHIIFSAAFGAYAIQLAIQILAPADIGLLSSIAANCQIFAAPTLAICFYLLLIRHEKQLARSRVAQWLSVMGRYSLSSYLVTSIVGAVFAYGFSLFNEMSFGAAMLIAIVLYCLLVLLANLLHAAGLRGPFERLIRSLSNSLNRFVDKYSRQEMKS